MSILVVHGKNLSRRRHLARVHAFGREHGQRVLLLMKNPSWESEHADRVVTVDTSVLGDTLAAAVRLRDEESEPIRAVVTFSERLVPAAARIAAELGLPYVSEHTAHIARDKYAMREAVAAAGGVLQPRYGLARSLPEARELAGRFGYPLILKPVIGTGSMYVRCVADDAELAEHFEFLRAESWDASDQDPLYRAAHEEYGGALLVEEFVPGTEICIESLVHRGETRVVAIHDKPLPTGPTFEEVYACTPTRLPADLVRTITDATAAVHRAMGIEIGPTHVEFRLRDEREPVLLEAAARMGGGPIYRSVQLSLGIDLVEAALEQALGGEPRLEPATAPRPVGFWNIFPEQPGVLTAVHGVEEAAADPRIDEFEIYREIGEYLKVPPQTFQGHGHLIFTVDEVDQLDGVFAELTKTVRLDTAPAGRDGAP
ncbi:MULTISPECIES: ATP-grasp domain-containing protein [Microbispora]|uniref:Argininosuccinate lyase n=1 Tax=Microbispora siamensis TaxID=564413 RepID=A0ABQ4GZ77_9ACTN|nr:MULTISPECIES: ATP-grasp domain-containing protein [Microbispora]OPG12352.1 hypothetical protein B1L11_15130 [Microbispora sp. GKU 823]GIH66722.1 argininosuccinate lyase [Microbispora siamensis]